MQMRKRKMDKAISTLLTLSLVLGIFSGTLPVYAEEAEPVEVATQNGPTQYSEDGVSEENISGESLENNDDSLQLVSSQPASSQPASLEVSSNEEQTQGGDSDTQSYTAYTTDSLDAVELEDTNELIVTNDAVSQVSSSEDTVISMKLHIPLSWPVRIIKCSRSRPSARRCLHQSHHPVISAPGKKRSRKLALVFLIQ